MTKEVDKKTQRAMAYLETYIKSKKAKNIDYYILSKIKKQKWPSIATPVKTVNDALVIGGFPKGRCSLVHGPEASGKTSLCLATIVSHLQNNPKALALVVDMEQALDDNIFELLGVDRSDPNDPVGSRILVVEPPAGDIAAELALEMVKSKMYDIVLLDSIDACQIGLQENKKKNISEEFKMGGLARLMGKFYREMATAVRVSKTAFVAINQERDNVDPVSRVKVTLPGGRAQKFYSSVIMRIQRIQTLMEKDIAIGLKVKAKVSKNKLGPSFRIAEYNFYFDKGFDIAREVIEMAIDANIIWKEKETSKKLNYKDQSFYKKDIPVWFDEHPEEMEELKLLVFGEDASSEADLDTLDDKEEIPDLPQEELEKELVIDP